MTTIPYLLTKLDIAALQQADYLTVMLTNGVSRVLVGQQVKETLKRPFTQDGVHQIEAPIHVTNSGNAQGRFYASMNFDRRFRDTHISAVTAQLRVGDAISFQFYADYLTSEVIRTAKLHADVLRLQVRRGKRLFIFEIDHVIAPSGAARMCEAAYKELSLVTATAE